MHDIKSTFCFLQKFNTIRNGVPGVVRKVGGYKNVLHVDFIFLKNKNNDERNQLK
jgi:hypothetical protein